MWLGAEMFGYGSTNFLELVRELYGDKKVKWASGKLRSGQKVKIIITDESIGEQRIVSAIATGRRKQGKNIIRYRDDNKRTWMLPMDNENIQVAW